MKTFALRKEDVINEWFIVDAQDKTLGRLATQVATRLRGKHKACYTPHVDTGDFIIVVNADKIKATGNKEADKMYYRHSGYPGGLKSIALGDLRKKDASKIIEHAVKGMLPRGPLGRSMFTKLKVYQGTQHPHAAQQPKELNI
jgi:large subunit ribosomal protein L13